MLNRTLSSDLGALTDQLTEALRDAESALASLELGVEAGVPLSPAPGLVSPEPVHLWFRRHGKGWRLMVVAGDQANHLLCAPRGTRIAAAHCLPALLAELRSTALYTVERVREAHGAVRTFIDTLPPSS